MIGWVFIFLYLLALVLAVLGGIVLSEKTSNTKYGTLVSVIFTTVVYGALLAKAGSEGRQRIYEFVMWVVYLFI